MTVPPDGIWLLRMSMVSRSQSTTSRIGQRAGSKLAKQQTIEAVEIGNGRDQRGRRPHPRHVVDAVVTRRIDHSEPRLVHLRVQPADIGSGRKLSIPEPGMLNDSISSIR